MDALITGFLLGFGLILAIGAQNAFVLRQGLRGVSCFARCADMRHVGRRFDCNRGGGLRCVAGRSPLG